jgi:hypothetical protein
MELLLTIILLAPAYAEVNCNTGGYTGWRYRFANEAFEPDAALYSGKVWYKGAYPVNRIPHEITAEYRTKTNCLVA